MRIALIADTHGYLDPRIARAIADCDLIVHAGDVGAGVAETLAQLAPPAHIVAGNNDPDDAPWPETRAIDLPGGRLVVVHGHQWPARNRHRKLRERFAGARAVVCGHSHRAALDRDGRPWVLNPGAAGRTRTYGGPGCILLSAGARAWRIRDLRLERA